MLTAAHVMVDFNNSGFSEEQISYLSGFVSGILQARDLPFLGQDSKNCFTHQPTEADETVHVTVIGDLCREEVIEHEQHGLDCYDTPGHTDLTTRAKLQVREIMPKHCAGILMKLADLGLTSQGGGADNVRNTTATPTTGLDPASC